MEDLHDIFTKFKKDFPKVHSDHEALGKEIHEKSGPLTPKTCWLIKIAVSGASRHELALETHIMKAKEAGVLSPVKDGPTPHRNTDPFDRFLMS